MSRIIGERPSYFDNDGAAIFLKASGIAKVHVSCILVGKSNLYRFEFYLKFRLLAWLEHFEATVKLEKFLQTCSQGY
jgi:hypothetical protein